MKNFKLVLLFTSIILMSFGKKERDHKIYDANNIEVIVDLEDVSQNGWSNWKTTSCFRYLKYQIKKANNDNGEWYIRIKNNYNKSASMSIVVEGNVPGRKDDGRFTIRSGNSYTQYYFVSKSSTRINFSLNKVKFGDTSWGGPYANCDD